jgi:predicted kinase
MTLFDDLVPSPDRPAIDWTTIEQAFEWFRSLDGCPQDPVFHAEGDVQIHTRMVCEALVEDPRWGRLGPQERASVFWAALLHDIAKPACTRVDAGGRVTTPNHSRRGQIAARQILWHMQVPFSQRERICHLVTHHQIPFYLLERDKPERRVHAISLQTRCDLLAILATADATGRICPDAGRLMDNIALFHELARQEQCLAEPKRFASPHSRFLYFRKPERAADYEAYDDWPGRATLLSGLPASGKDEWIVENAGAADVVSLDDLREELDVDPAGPQGTVVAAARERARAALRSGRPLIWNATNISRDMRKPLIDLFAAYRAKVTIVYLEASETVASRRNSERASPVPAKAIARMLERWEPPDLTECHDLVVRTT